MLLNQLEHILRASAAITGANEFVVIGTQALLGQFPGAPAELLLSMEADLFTFRDPQDAVLIEGSIGEGSPFHQTFGYYAHGVGIDTAVLPDGWRERLIVLSSPNTKGAAGYCLEIHDLAVSKLIPGREKDFQFIGALFRHGLADPGIMRERLSGLTLDPVLMEAAAGRLARLAR